MILLDNLYLIIFGYFTNDTSHSVEKNSKINDMCGGDSENESGEQSEKDNLLQFAIKKLLGDPEQKENPEFYPSIEKIIQELHGSTFAEKLEKINISAKASWKNMMKSSRMN